MRKRSQVRNITYLSHYLTDSILKFKPHLFSKALVLPSTLHARHQTLFKNQTIRATRIRVTCSITQAMPTTNTNNDLYQSIDKGFCGSVWTPEGTDTIVKRKYGGPGRSLTNDYNMHILLLQSAAQYLSPSSPINMPEC